VRNRAGLIARIETITATEPRRYWLERLEAHGIPCGPINNYAEAFADPQIRAREMIAAVDHPTLGRLHTPGSPIKMSVTPPVVNRRAPLLGEHTSEVLREVGYSDEEISLLR
jgi:crotonobetainyl-CoA:carnitine CoA-transferase CaiB-like acyl-CoA transferase